MIDISVPGNIASFVTEKFRNRDSWMAPYYKRWLQNIAFFEGNQNVIWDTVRNKLVTRDSPPHRVRLVVNLIMPQVYAKIAKILKTEPIWDVLPATDQNEDITVAETATSVLQYYWQSGGMSDVYLETLLWTFITGNAFIKTAWDPRAGQRIPIGVDDFMDEVPEGVFDEKLQKKLRREAIRKYRESTGQIGTGKLQEPDEVAIGDVKHCCRSGFELTIDPAVTKLSEAQWVIESSVKSVSEAELMFPGETFTSESVGNTLGLHYIERIKELNLGRTKNTSDQVIIHSCYFKPTPKAKLGKYAIVVNGRELLNIDNPYQNYFPFTHFKEISSPGKFWGESMVTHMIPVQAVYNRKRSRIEENANLVGNPKILIPGGLQNKQEITNAPGEKLTYHPSYGPPSYLQPPELPRYHSEALGFDRQDLEDITGQHEASQGEAPGSVRGTHGILALQERDEDRLLPTLTFNERALMDVGRQTLKIISQYVTEDRLLKILGENNDRMVTVFRGSDLVGQNAHIPNADYFDVRVKLHSGLPLTRSGQQKLMESLVNTGFLSPQIPEDRSLVFRILRLGDLQSQIPGFRMDQAKATQENYMMLQGMPTTVQVFAEEHDVHIRSHQQFFKTQKFTQLPQQMKQLFYDHVEQHRVAKTLLQLAPQVDQMMVMQQLQQTGQIPNELLANLAGSVAGPGQSQPGSTGAVSQPAQQVAAGKQSATGSISPGNDETGSAGY